MKKKCGKRRVVGAFYTEKFQVIYQYVFVKSVADIFCGVGCVLCTHLPVVVGVFMKWKYL
jgi:hypothetical protein